MEAMLSTSDNPYNPWTHFEQWYAWDMQAGYQTSSYVARIYAIYSANGKVDEDVAMEATLEDIIERNVTGLYVLVPKPDDYEEEENVPLDIEEESEFD